MLKTHFSNLKDIVYSIFWLGVRENVSAAAEVPHIGIRRAWDVVRRADDDESAGDGVEIIMTPMGPALSMKTSVPKDFLELFMKRER